MTSATGPGAKRATGAGLELSTVTPGLTVSDLDRSMAFYVDGLGFTVAERWERDGKLAGVMVSAGRCMLGLGQDDWAKGRDRVKGVGFRLWLATEQDVDAIAARAKAAGLALDQEPEDTDWGARAFALTDPDGFKLTILREPSRPAT